MRARISLNFFYFSLSRRRVNPEHVFARVIAGLFNPLSRNGKNNNQDSTVIVEGAGCQAAEAPLSVHAEDQTFRSDDGKFSHNVGRMARIHRSLPEGRQGAGLEDGHTAGFPLQQGAHSVVHHPAVAKNRKGGINVQKVSILPLPNNA